MENGTPLPTSRVEQVNQLVRAIIVLVLIGGMTYGFIVSKVVSTESYLIIVSIAMTWWFKSRDEQSADKKPAQPAPLVTITPAPTP